MISQKMSEMLNAQINKEFYSAYLYLSMSAYFDEIGLTGFAHWTRLQAHEELEHGMLVFDFIIENNGTVSFHPVNAPEHSFTCATNAFEQALEHERSITEMVNGIADFADNNRERAVQLLMDWFVKEQTEEEEAIRVTLDRLKLFGSDCTSLFLMDKEMSERET